MSEIERRNVDRRMQPRDSMQTNPEVMGRTEPRTMDPTDRTDRMDRMDRTDQTDRMDRTQAVDTRPAMAGTATEPVDGRTTTQSEMFPEMNEILLRFEQLQSEFIDEPREAVKKAERLMQEAVEKITKSMRERVQTMHRDVEGNDDTERLRQVMRSYLDMIDSLTGRRAA